MSDNAKMLLRYSLSIGLAFAVGRGWISTDQGGAISNIVIEVAAVLAAYLPAVYAAFKIDNAPKT